MNVARVATLVLLPPSSTGPRPRTALGSCGCGFGACCISGGTIGGGGIAATGGGGGICTGGVTRFIGEGGLGHAVGVSGIGSSVDFLVEMLTVGFGSAPRCLYISIIVSSWCSCEAAAVGIPFAALTAFVSMCVASAM